MKNFRLSPSLVLSTLAVAVATSSTAVAASVITGSQVRDSSLTGRDIKNRSLTPADFQGSVRGPAGSQGPAGAQGVAGPQGAPGAQGPAGPTALGTLTRVEGPEVTVLAGDGDSATATCPAGQGVVSGGFRSIAADGEVFADDSFGSPNSWSALLDNFDSTIEVTIIAIAYCAPSNRAISPRSAGSGAAASIARLLAERRATG